MIRSLAWKCNIILIRSKWEWISKEGVMNKLGIDIGYSTLKYVYLDNNDNLIESNYIFHKGD